MYNYKKKKFYLKLLDFINLLQYATLIQITVTYKKNIRIGIGTTIYKKEYNL